MQHSIVIGDKRNLVLSVRQLLPKRLLLIYYVYSGKVIGMCVRLLEPLEGQAT